MAERPGPVREWRIHLGAHKTATTHLQQTLEAHRPALVERGVDFIHFRAFRSVATPYVRPNSWQRRLWSPPVARRFERALDGLRATGPDTVLLSDEDILGYSRDQLGRTLYPQPGRCIWCAIWPAGPNAPACSLPSARSTACCPRPMPRR